MIRKLSLLAILAIISMVCMPFGYMPAAAADGSMILRICDGYQPSSPAQAHEAEHAHKGHEMPASEHSAHDDGTHEARCNFAVMAVGNLPAEPAFVALPPQPIELSGAITTPLTATFPPNLPPATGPPAPV